MSVHGSVTSYASEGQRLWSLGVGAHGRWHACLTCSDTRAYLGLPPLVLGAANLFGVTLVQSFEREERVAS